MAIYRLIYRGAGTGDRISELDHLEFRVWVQYQLTADDYGICPAEAVKLQGDNVSLQNESQRRIQTAIERLVEVGLCGVFHDGRRRYLYQADWQDRQRLRHFTATDHPTLPDEALARCTSKTRSIFADRIRKDAAEVPEDSRNAPAILPQDFGNSSATLRPHAGACDAHAHANAAANDPERGLGRTRPGGRGLIVGPAAFHKQHGSHVSGFCDFVCLPQPVFDDFLNRVIHAGASEPEADAQVRAWAESVRQAWQGRIPGADIFKFWRNEWAATHGENTPGKGVDVTAGLRGI